MYSIDIHGTQHLSLEHIVGRRLSFSLSHFSNEAIALVSRRSWSVSSLNDTRKQSGAQLARIKPKHFGTCRWRENKEGGRVGGGAEEGGGQEIKRSQERGHMLSLIQYATPFIRYV